MSEEASINQMTDAEILNYHQLKDIMFSLVEVNKSGSAELHSPHALSVFCHSFFHEVVAEDLIDSMEEARSRGAEVADFEPSMRRGLEAAMLMGYRFARAGYIFDECQCGDLTEDKILALFNVKEKDA